MKINFTKKEYELLIKALNMADWILHAHDEERKPSTKPFRDLEQKVLSYAKDYGMEKMVEFDRKYNEYYHSRELESEIMQFINEYDNNTFWEELISRLSMRDLNEKFGFEEVLKMEALQKFEELGIVEEKYSKEMAANGLKYLRLRSV